MSKFRENLKQELAYNDMRVKELAEKTGISKHTIDHYLAENSSEPLAEAAVKIAKVLNVSVEYLVTGNDENKTNSFRTDIDCLVKKINLLPKASIKVLSALVDLIG